MPGDGIEVPGFLPMGRGKGQTLGDRFSKYITPLRPRAAEWNAPSLSSLKDLSEIKNTLHRIPLTRRGHPMEAPQWEGPGQLLTLLKVVMQWF